MIRLLFLVLFALRCFSQDFPFTTHNCRRTTDGVLVCPATTERIEFAVPDPTPTAPDFIRFFAMAGEDADASELIERVRRDLVKLIVFDQANQKRYLRILRLIDKIRQ